MTKKKSDISDDDRDLFRDAVKGTKPLTQDKVQTVAKQPKARRKTLEQEVEFDHPEWSDHVEETLTGDDFISFNQSGVSQKVMRQLRQGKLPLEARLDCHGLTVAETRQHLHLFINDCIAQQLRTVLVIHGKGFQSTGGGKLKSNIVNWLKQSSRVLAACSALKQDGGTGALYVRLSK